NAILFKNNFYKIIIDIFQRTFILFPNLVHLRCMNFKTNRSNCEIYSHYPSDTHPCAFIQLDTQFNLSLNGTRAAQSPNIVFKLPSAASCRLLSSVEPYAGETEFLSSQSTPVNPLSRSQYTTIPPVAVPPEGSAYISIPSDA